MRKPLAATGVVLYNIVVICALLGAAEYATRVLVYHPHGPRSREPEVVFDRWTAFRNNPGYARDGVQHTSEGFRRDTPISLEKPANTVRIVLMGGSVTYGGDTLYPEIDARRHIRDDQTIDSYLERRLNAELPSKRWEVINAGVKGYLLHQDLALILSVVLRYKPDHVILLDGVNDLSSLLRASERYDPYSATRFLPQFNSLTSPGSLRSLRLTLAAALRNDSALFRWAQDSMLERFRVRARMKRANEAPAANSLTADEQVQYLLALKQLDYYPHVIRQIHQVLTLDGIQDLFLLQPELFVSRKPLAGPEPRLADYSRKVETRLFIHGFETLYPELAKRLTQNAQSNGYRFMDLTSAFDQMTDQAFTDYCHLTPEGNRALANWLFEYLAAKSRETP